MALSGVNMSTAYVCGFSEEALGLIVPYLEDRGPAEAFCIRRADFDDGVVRQVAADPGPCLVIVDVVDEVAAAKLRAMTARLPRHVYLAGVRSGDYGLLATVSRCLAEGMIVLSGNAADVHKALACGLRRLRCALMRERFDRGIRRRDLEVQLRTSDVLVGETSRRLAEMLREDGFATDGAEVDGLAVGIEEALVNAIEHGNLELDSALRPATMEEEDRYEKLKTERLEKAEYGDRSIFLRIHTDGQVAILSIRDEGSGFDHRGNVESEGDGRAVSQTEIMSVSGKGIGMIGRVFDSVRYERNGTEIILERRKDR